MRKWIAVLAGCVLASGAAAQEYLPTAHVELAFGGAPSPALRLNLAASQLRPAHDDAPFLQVVGLHVDGAGAPYTSLLGVPVRGVRMALAAAEAEGGSRAWLWLGGAAVAGALVLASGGGSDDGASTDPRSESCIYDETVVGSPEETADAPEVGDCGL